MSYTATITPSAGRMLEALPRRLRERIRAKIDALASNPRPPGSIKLAGTTNTYRIRVGDYRVLYEIHDDRRLVIVFIVAHRRESYRGL